MTVFYFVIGFIVLGILLSITMKLLFKSFLPAPLVGFGLIGSSESEECKLHKWEEESLANFTTGRREIRRCCLECGSVPSENGFLSKEKIENLKATKEITLIQKEMDEELLSLAEKLGVDRIIAENIFTQGKAAITLNMALQVLTPKEALEKLKKLRQEQKNAKPSS